MYYSSLSSRNLFCCRLMHFLKAKFYYSSQRAGTFFFFKGENINTIMSVGSRLDYYDKSKPRIIMDGVNILTKLDGRWRPPSQESHGSADVASPLSELKG